MNNFEDPFTFPKQNGLLISIYQLYMRNSGGNYFHFGFSKAYVDIKLVLGIIMTETITYSACIHMINNEICKKHLHLICTQII
jgi:hypothetical protein